MGPYNKPKFQKKHNKDLKPIPRLLAGSLGNSEEQVADSTEATGTMTKKVPQ